MVTMVQHADHIGLRLLSDKFLIIIGALFVPLIAMKFVLKNENIDVTMVYLILSVGFIAGIYIFRQSLKISYLPYLLLQLVIIWIFFDSKITAATGVQMKLYALAFGLAFAAALYYIWFNAGYLWRNFPVYRLLLIFFIINIGYFFFYRSDFRSWYSSYIDIWLMRPEVRLYFMHQGMDVFEKTFTETRYVGMYLGSLAPLVCLTVSLFAFYELKSIKDINLRLISIIKFVIIALAIYFTAALFFVLIGTSSIGFVDGRLWGDFLGFGQAFAIYLSYYLLLLVGFKYFINIAPEKGMTNVENIAIKLFITICLILILLQINKTVIIALTASMLVFWGLCFMTGIQYNWDKKKEYISSDKNPIYLKLILIVFGIIFFILTMQYSETILDALTKTIERLNMRFGSFGTFNIRTTVWEYFIEYWYQNLTVFKVIFGFGLDASREAAFRISSIIAGDIRTFSSPLVHIHNLYLQMFYEYGLIAFLYFGALLVVVFDNLRQIFKANAHNYTRLFSILSMSVIIFFAIFGLTEIVRIPIAIVFFSLIGFLESLKYAYNRAIDSEDNLLTDIKQRSV
jgi:O-antigen ligase